MRRRRPVRKGKKRVVKPLKGAEQIEFVRKTLENKPQELLLFDLITQTGVLLRDLLPLRVKHLQNLGAGERLPIALLKTKSNPSPNYDPVMTETTTRSFQRYLNIMKPNGDEFLFKSRKGSMPLKISSVSHLVKSWFDAANLEGLTGVKSLRRTWKVYLQVVPKTPEEPNLANDPMELLKPAKKETLRKTVYEELVQAIATGRLPPGERLLADRIARHMKVSQMPVREALRKLETTGFITSQPTRGSVVNELSKDTLIEITKIRLVLESMAVESATIHITEETINHLAEIDQLYKRAIRKNDFDEAISLNREFHHAIYRAANMPILEQLIEGLWMRISPYFHILIRDMSGSRWQNIVSSHGHIVNCLRRRCPLEATKWLRNALEETLTEILILFDSVEKM